MKILKEKIAGPLGPLNRKKNLSPLKLNLGMEKTMIVQVIHYLEFVSWCKIWRKTGT